MIRPVKPTVGRRGREGKGTAGTRGGSADVREELWTKFLRTRWKKHRNLLVENYLPLVRSVAEQVAAKLPRSVDADDLISAGVFGLLQSVENFDPDRGTKFETYCRVRIRGAMIDELRTQDLLSREARDRANHLGDALQRLRQELGREPNPLELSQETGLRLREIDDILRKAGLQSMISLDSGILESRSHQAPVPVSEDLVDAELEPPDLVHQKDLLLLIARNLSELERDILLLRYRDGLTMRGIGRVLGLSESRVCQVHGGLIARLHRRLSTEA